MIPEVLPVLWGIAPEFKPSGQIWLSWAVRQALMQPGWRLTMAYSMKGDADNLRLAMAS